MTRWLRHRLFWPVFSLLALVVVNTAVRPQFMRITVRDGELYGALIDILRNSAPLMLVALGMTLVIATRGIDLSVGAVMAVSGAVTLTIIDGASDPGSTSTVLVAMAVGIGIALIQALTQIQEITLTFVPKIVAIMLVVALTGPFIGGQISSFTNVIFERIQNGF